jgi:hypothetical protein
MCKGAMTPFPPFRGEVSLWGSRLLPPLRGLLGHIHVPAHIICWGTHSCLSLHYMGSQTFMLCRTLHETTHIHEIQNITCMSPHSCTFAHYMPSRTFITLPLAKGLIKLSGSMPGPTLYATLYIHEKLYITCDGVHSCIDPHCMRLYTFMPD